jgi:hypothetical protein
MILPNNRDACIMNLAGLVGTISCFLALAFCFRLAGILNLYTVGICSVAFGLVLYRIVLGTTWHSFVNESSGESNGKQKIATQYTSTTSILLSSSTGALAVLVIGVTWYHLARTGASKIIPLPKTCDAFVLKGSWIPANLCNEQSRGAAYREHDTGALGTCTQSRAWGWEATPSSSHCRFAERDSKSLLKILNNRNIQVRSQPTNNQKKCFLTRLVVHWRQHCSSLVSCNVSASWGLWGRCIQYDHGEMVRLFQKL